MDEYFVNKFNEARTIPEIFEVVKGLVWKMLSKSRAGLDLGMAEMGTSPQGMVGAFFALGSNLIIMNQTVINQINETNKEIMKPYIFSVLLHEYLHSLCIYSDEDVRMNTYSLAQEAFGDKSLVAQISKDMGKFFPNLVYPTSMPPDLEGKVKLVKDFDESDTRYIG